MSLGTAVLPVFSVELYLVTVLVAHPELDWWIAGPVVAIGQLLGKSVHYLIARGVISRPRVMHGTVRRTGRWGGWRERFEDPCAHHPGQATPMLAASAVAGTRRSR